MRWQILVLMTLMLASTMGFAQSSATQTYLCPNGEVIETSQRGSQERRRATANLTLAEEAVAFDDLPGWGKQASPDTLLRAIDHNCDARRLPEGWSKICADESALKRSDVHGFIEQRFTPYRITVGEEDKGLFTSYYASYVGVSRSRTDQYDHPIYRNSEKARSLSRREIEQHALDDSEVLFWSDNAFDAYILQVQGSGVGLLPDGSKVNIAYAGKNRKNYVSLGKVLSECGELARASISLPTIRAWVNEATPEAYQRLVSNNQSYVFFSESDYTGVPPKGALAVPLTPMRSLAVDTRYFSLGTMFYVSVPQPEGPRIEQLFLAQDKGGAISGGIRADIFAGEGEAAGRFAGRMAHRGNIWRMKPKQTP